MIQFSIALPYDDIYISVQPRRGGGQSPKSLYRVFTLVISTLRGFRLHDDVIKWKIFRVTGHLYGEFPSEWPVTRGFDFFFDLCPKKRLSKNRKTGILRRHRAHYDVIVMMHHGLKHLQLWYDTPAAGTLYAFLTIRILLCIVYDTFRWAVGIYNCTRQEEDLSWISFYCPYLCLLITHISTYAPNIIPYLVTWTCLRP